MVTEVLSALTDVGTGCCAVILGGGPAQTGRDSEKVTPQLNAEGLRVFLCRKKAP